MFRLKRSSFLDVLSWSVFNLYGFKLQVVDLQS